MHRTVAELVDSLTAEELAGWVAYNRISPIDDLRADYGHALTASMIANVHRKAGSPPIQPKDLMPWQDQGPPREAMDSETEARMMKAALSKIGFMNGGPTR